MRLMDVDKFLRDLKNDGCDVINADARCPLYTEFGYSYELIKRVIERQDLINTDADEAPEFKIGYCPICNRKMEVRTDRSWAYCPVCAHRLAMN